MRSDSLHVTFAFLGEIDEERAEVAGELVRSVEPRRVRMRLGSEIRGLPRKRPRVLALDEVGGEVGGLQADVAVSLAEVGVLGPEKTVEKAVLVAHDRRQAEAGCTWRSLRRELHLDRGAARRRGDSDSRCRGLDVVPVELGRGPATYTALATVELTGGGG